MRYLLCVSFALSLAGCVGDQSPLSSQAPADDQQCQSMGYKQGTQTYLECRQLLLNQHVADNQSARTARENLGDRLTALGAAMQARDRPMTQTSCTPKIGGGMDCTTY